MISTEIGICPQILRKLHNMKLHENAYSASKFNAWRQKDGRKDRWTEMAKLRGVYIYNVSYTRICCKLR
jgi:hypothetical protein